MQDLVGTLPRGCRCAMCWCDLDLTFDLAVLLPLKHPLSGIFLGFCEVQDLVQVFP